MTNIIHVILTLILINDLVTAAIQSDGAKKLPNNLPLVQTTFKSHHKDAHNTPPSDTNNGTISASDDDTCNITTIISKSSGQIKSVNYPDPYPTNCQWTYAVHVGDGHNIQLKVLDLDLDTDAGDELLIQPISSKDKNTNANSYVYALLASNNSITSTTTTESFKLNIPCCDSAIIKFTVGNHSNNHTGFLLIYQRNEESTTEKSASNSLGWHQVYLCGMPLDEFYQHEEDFKNSLIDTVEKYSKENNLIPETEKISLHQILINMVVPCPSSWPSSSNCLQLNYSVKLDDTPTPDELTSEHLEEMWYMYRDTDELTNLGLWEYEIPNVQWLFWFWIGLLCFLSLFFCLLLIIIVKTRLINYYFLRLKLTNSQEMNDNLVMWQQQNMTMPLFTAENDQRFQFVRSYEKLNSIKPSRSFQNITSIDAEEGNSKTAHDDLESEYDQHIYQTLTSVTLMENTDDSKPTDYLEPADSSISTNSTSETPTSSDQLETKP